ncbi:Protein CBG26310 [Caenorhabditis briggsae]|uniref:Protein CBG26310 n=1 Tax=Caenorhabditis briggsae TaxID=6238 RepID=B6IG83_CAEBR|nr:Protein CBG26310 [Caenorhabditis briggsae]CAR98913.1 Protein CBG26310 [Caenorhabditis briggsae]
MDGVHLPKLVNIPITDSSCFHNISRILIQHGPPILDTHLWQVSLFFWFLRDVFSAFPTLQLVSAVVVCSNIL